MNTTPTTYVNQLETGDADRLRQLLQAGGWIIDTVAHARWRARKNKTTVVAYNSGKLVVQGKGTGELVQFTIEPEILGQARFGYEHLLAEEENPAMFEPHIGVDESGKGDYFGPLVIAAVYVDPDKARRLLKLGVQDSKKIGGDKKITELKDKIIEIVNGLCSLVAIGPQAYNRLYGETANLNRMLGWGHAKALENTLTKVPQCPRAISDKFGHESSIRKALQHRGKKIELIQIPRAEADVAVAAASILARAEFVRRLAELSDKIGFQLPKGAGPPVLKAASRAVREKGPEVLDKIAKKHFKTTIRVLNSNDL